MPFPVDPYDPVSFYSKDEVDQLLADLPAGGEGTGTYSKPADGIPESDLSASVNASLGRADSSLQPGQVSAGLDAEGVRDTVAAFLQQGSGVTLSHDDAADKLTVSSTAIGGAVDTSKGINVRGVSGANDTERIQNAYNQRGSRPLYFPAGTYNVTALPDFANDFVANGDGPRNTTITYTGTGTCRTLSSKYGIQFNELGFDLSQAGATFFRIGSPSQSFRVSFDRCRFRGRHDATGATYRTQVGVFLDNNTGASNFVNCDFENLGSGIRTNSIQNYVIGGKFTHCWNSIWGDTGTRPVNAGLYVTNSEFVGCFDPADTNSHVLIDGPANCWQFDGCWWEKATWMMRIGGTSAGGNGGPSQLAMFGGKMGIGPGGGIQLNNCRQAQLTNIEFDSDVGTSSSSRKVLINAGGCPNGVAMNLTSTVNGLFARSEFPSAWHVFL